jgi:prevent-host-death family protein
MLVMTKTVGIFEAKTHFSALLKEIEQGREITITKHGRPVAKLVPVGEGCAMDRVQAIEGLLELQGRLRLKGDWREFRDAGRR